MKVEEIKNPVETLSGVGKAKAVLFSKLNVFTVGDLLTFYPRDYEDRRKTVAIKDFQTGKVHTLANVLRHEWFGFGKMKTLKIVITDGTAQASLICFSRPFMQKQFPEGCKICVTGTFQVKYGELQSSSFEVTKIEESETSVTEGEHGSTRESGSYGAGSSVATSGSFSASSSSAALLPDAKIYPIYHLTEGLTQNQVRKAVSQALKTYNKSLDSSVPERYIKERGLISKSEALLKIHQPETPDDIKKARESLVYEELFNFQYVLAKRTLKHKGLIPSPELTPPPLFQMQKTPTREEFSKELSPLQKGLYDSISFDLTEDQKKVILTMNAEIDRGYMERNDILLGKKLSSKAFTMQRLLQGDVGSGKTLTALFSALRVINWKGQCAFMAPTEILARQHADTLARLLEPLGLKTAFLTGNIKASGRTQLLKALKSGEINIVVGTHALFSQDVTYNDLQLAIIDEQHRFGVVQREAIISKGRNLFEPCLLMMSATPIPQTLALTVFGDLDVSVIHSMPLGRKPINTYLVKEGNERNAYEAVRRELATGHQAYFVYPAIESEQEGNALKNAAKAFENLSSNVYPEYRCALIHSKVPEEEQIQILKDFREGKIQVLAATTVIEVGVDVPNATSIVIEAADRFGLSQLHQLRGRVGRGAEQSYCYLIYSEKITESGIQRMKVLRESTDGFLIAEQDLKLRGPGELNGKMQSGELNLGLSDLERDKDTLIKARYDAFNFAKDTLR